MSDAVKNLHTINDFRTTTISCTKRPAGDPFFNVIGELHLLSAIVARMLLLAFIHSLCSATPLQRLVSPPASPLPRRQLCYDSDSDAPSHSDSSSEPYSDCDLGHGYGYGLGMDDEEGEGEGEGEEDWDEYSPQPHAHAAFKAVYGNVYSDFTISLPRDLTANLDSSNLCLHPPSITLPFPLPAQP